MKVELYPVGEVLRCTERPTESVTKLPFYGKVPKDLRRNLLFRKAIREKARRDSVLQAELREMCAVDPLFWLNTFCYLQEPRAKVKHIPLISWPHQDTFFMAMYEYLGRRDIGVEKSRGEGASWLFLMLFLHGWLFDTSGPMFSLVSKNEEAVDKPGDANSLMYKLDYQMDRLPFWMRPASWNPRTDRQQSNHSIINRDTKSTIIGYAATGDVVRGGRPTAMGMDEMAAFPAGSDYAAFNATQHATECRIIISTPQGDTNAFADIMHRQSTMLKLVVHWTENPYRKAGLYTLGLNGRIRMIDPDYGQLPSDYEVPREYGYEIPEGGYWFSENIFLERGTKVWSPWYDSQCRRPNATTYSIAQELDLNYGGSSYKFFGPALEIARRGARRPIQKGEITWTVQDDPGVWVDDENGRFLLWRKLNEDGRLPPGWFAVGCDVSAGTGGDYSSNSVIEVIDQESQEQVMEFAAMDISPEDLARLASALCQWLNVTGSSVMLNWDAMGPTGAQFTKSLIENTRWRRVFMQMRDVTRRGKRERIPRYGMYQRDRMQILGPLRDAVIHGGLKLYSIDAVRECGEWELKNGHIVHVQSARASIEVGETHGDRAIALAQAWHLCTDRKLPPKEEEPKKLPWNCMAWRFEHAHLAPKDDTLLEACW